MQSPEELRRRASHLLSLAINAQAQGQNEVAAQLMAQAFKYLDEIGAPKADACNESTGDTQAL